MRIIESFEINEYQTIRVVKAKDGLFYLQHVVKGVSGQLIGTSQSGGYKGYTSLNRVKQSSLYNFVKNIVG